MTGMTGGTASTVRRKAAPSSQSNRATVTNCLGCIGRAFFRKCFSESSHRRANLWLELARRHAAENRWRAWRQRIDRHHAIVNLRLHDDMTYLDSLHPTV